MSTALPLDPATFIPRFSALARQSGFSDEQFGEVHGHALVAYTRPLATDAPRIYVSSGIHGDEPAPPWALLRLMEEGFFDDRASWFVCPLLNPTGFVRGTRENHRNLDLNRDYKQPVSDEIHTHVRWLQRQPDFTVSFCLHEDYEASGFYLYELNPEKRPTLADAALAAAARHGHIEHAAVIDGRAAAAPGIIRPTSDPLLRESWPEAIYLRHKHTTLSYTFETPTALPLERRIAAQTAALRAAVKQLFLS